MASQLTKASKQIDSELSSLIAHLALRGYAKEAEVLEQAQVIIGRIMEDVAQGTDIDDPSLLAMEVNEVRRKYI